MNEKKFQTRNDSLMEHIKCEKKSEQSVGHRLMVFFFHEQLAWSVKAFVIRDAGISLRTLK